jgi:hypothetical protein
MKKAFAVLACLCLMISGLAVGVSAETNNANSVLVNIPFAFHVDNKLVPSGDYYFDLPRIGASALGSIIRVTSADGEFCQYLHTMRVDGITTDTDYHVIFTKYGDSYFLSEVKNSEFGVELRRSRAEKELATEYDNASLAASTIELTAKPSRAK